MKWVTRARPKIDRIACPWLIARFIDKEPEFLYVAADRVLDVAQETGAVPYDVPGVQYGHVGDSCSRTSSRRSCPSSCWRHPHAQAIAGSQYAASPAPPSGRCCLA